jgi:hypothetical protein
VIYLWEKSCGVVVRNKEVKPRLTLIPLGLWDRSDLFLPFLLEREIIPQVQTFVLFLRIIELFVYVASPQLAGPEFLIRPDTSANLCYDR